MPKDPNVMPAGSMPPEDSNPEDNTDAQSANKGKGGDTPNSEDAKYLGKFKTPEEMASSYKELENKLSQQGQELNKLRSTVPAPEQNPAANADVPGYELQRKELLEKIDTGDVSLAEGLAALDQLTREATEAKMEAKFADYDQARTANEMFDNFVSDNPLFLELDNTGKLDELIQQNPIHDKVSAFYEIKAEMDAEAAFNKGREEALRIAKGSEGTRSVLSNPGAETREAPTPKKGASNAEVVQGMMGALAAARA